MSATVVVGVGNLWRGDDAAGLEVARRVRRAAPTGVEVLEREGEPSGLLPTFERAVRLVLVDAISSGAPAGTVHRLDASAVPVPASLYRASSHHFSLAETIELARALGKLPARTVLYGIEGQQFAAGAPMSGEVEDALDEVAAAVLRELEEA